MVGAGRERQVAAQAPHDAFTKNSGSASRRSIAWRTASVSFSREVVFTAQTTLEHAQAFYADVMARLPKFGRSPEEVCVLPGLHPVLGRTRAEAEDKFAYLQSLIEPSVGLALLGHAIGVANLSQHPLDGPAPEMGETNGPRSRQALLLEAARRDRLTLRELCQLNAGPRGHLMVCGTPSEVVDPMEHWFRNGAADGFNVMPAWLPGSLTDFVDMAAPELQRRGLHRTSYGGRTLRDHLGLPHPRGSMTGFHSDPAPC